MTQPASNFFERTRNAKKVMVLDLGFLGDTVHLLPALWKIRQAYPQAELHVTVSSHIVSLMECVPWVQKTWGYTRYPRHATLRENIQMVASLRREKFDALINLNGSDRSSWLTFFSGARERLGRRPNDGGPLFWEHMFTAHVRHPPNLELIYLQHCRCLEKAGFPPTPPEFHAEVDSAQLKAAQIDVADTGRYFHVSPFTTADRKELPPEQMAEFLCTLKEAFPGQRFVLSCAPMDRERKKMADLLTRLPWQPWRVFPGSLTLPQLAAVIQHSTMHLSGDTGPMHLAAMTNTPAVMWFWPNPGRNQWIPIGEQYRVIFGGKESDSPFLGKIITSELVEAVRDLLKSRD
jgi:heptosyltransferase-3